MHSFRFRPRLEGFEDRLTPAVGSGDWMSAAFHTVAGAEFFRRTADDPDWMFNPNLQSFVQTKLLSIVEDAQSATAVFAAAPSDPMSAGLEAVAQANRAMAVQIGDWLGINVVPPAPPAPPAPPTVTINQATGQFDPTSTGPIQFAVGFSKPVTGFTTSDIDLSGSSLTGLTASVSGSGKNYTVSITGMTGSGTVVAKILAGAATDAAGLLSRASTSTDNTVTFSPAPTDVGMTNTMPDPNAPDWTALGAQGLKTWDVVQGTGDPLQTGDSIMVFYTGWLAANGTQFDAKRSPSAPASFNLNGLIQGWQQGLIGMRPGGIRRLFVPSALGYGTAGSGTNIPPNADLVFEIKLVSHT